MQAVPCPNVGDCFFFSVLVVGLLLLCVGLVSGLDSQGHSEKSNLDLLPSPSFERVLICRVVIFFGNGFRRKSHQHP